MAERDDTGQGHAPPARDFPELKVRLVDGFEIRNRSLDAQEFGSFATHLQFDFIPEGEVWVDSRVPEGERRYMIVAAQAEVAAHKDGKDVDDAYEYGKTVQGAERELHDHEYGGDRPYHKEVPEDVYKGHWRTLESDNEKVFVYVVDGSKVRGMYKTDWVEGGHAFVYPYIPENEIWIEDQVRPEEREFVLLHESTERHLMKHGQMDYDDAHEAASKKEFAARQEAGEQHAKMLEVGLYKVLDRQGGVVPTDKSAAEEFDFITLPPWVKGTNCSNCLYLKKIEGRTVCGNVKLNGIEVNNRNCCALWDAPSVIRAWKKKEQEDSITDGRRKETQEEFPHEFDTSDERIVEYTADKKAMSAYNETSGGALVPPPQFRGRRPRRRRPVYEDQSVFGPFAGGPAKGLMPRNPRVKASNYFQECPRDETGHCRPKGTADMTGRDGGGSAAPHGAAREEEERREGRANAEQKPGGGKPARMKVWVPMDVGDVDPDKLANLQAAARQQLEQYGDNLTDCAAWLYTQLIQAGQQKQAAQKSLPRQGQKIAPRDGVPTGGYDEPPPRPGGNGEPQGGGQRPHMPKAPKVDRGQMAGEYEEPDPDEVGRAEAEQYIESEDTGEDSPTEQQWQATRAEAERGDRLRGHITDFVGLLGVPRNTVHTFLAGLQEAGERSSEDENEAVQILQNTFMALDADDPDGAESWLQTFLGRMEEIPGAQEFVEAALAAIRQRLEEGHGEGTEQADREAARDQRYADLSPEQQEVLRQYGPEVMSNGYIRMRDAGSGLQGIFEYRQGEGLVLRSGDIEVPPDALEFITALYEAQGGIL